MPDGIVVGDGGYLSQAQARELAARGVYLLTASRKHRRYLASQFPGPVCSCTLGWRKPSRF
jgi:hypothetical protein